MTHPDSRYEPPAVEVVPAENGPAETAAGTTSYGAITLMDDDCKTRSDD